MNNTVNDNTQNSMNTTPTFDPNTNQQPVQNLVDDLAGMPAAPVSNAPKEEFPAQQEIDNSFAQPQPMADASMAPVDTQASQPMMETPIAPVETQMNSVGQPEVAQNRMPSFDSPMGETQPMDTMPSVDMSAPLTQPSIPDNAMDSVIPQSEPMAQVTETPMPQFEAPVMAPDVTSPSPVDTLPTMSAEPVVPPSASMDAPVPVAPSLPSQDLSQPMPTFAAPSESPMPAFNESEIVNTLGESEKEGKGGTVVVIILIVVIIALLATIGYFAYKIFLS